MKFDNIYSKRGEFFTVLGGTDRSQLAVMTIEPGGMSGHENTHTGDQIVYVIEGSGEVELEDEGTVVTAGDALIISAGARHEIFNTGSAPLFFLNVYTPPQY